jgi:hypothetical protein
MKANTTSNGLERAARHRAALRARGLRPKQFWVPDTRSLRFAEQAALDSTAINAAENREDDLRFAEAAQHWPD